MKNFIKVDVFVVFITAIYYPSLVVHMFPQLSCTVVISALGKCKCVRSWMYGCLVTWFCCQLIAEPDNKTVAFSWPDPCEVTLQNVDKFIIWIADNSQCGHKKQARRQCVYLITYIVLTHMFYRIACDHFPGNYGDPAITIRWRHNEHDSVSNHQPHDCLLNHLFGRRSK